MLSVGGVVILDDTYYPSISRVVEHILTYPAYEVFATTTCPASATRTNIRRTLATWIPKLRREWDYLGNRWDYTASKASWRHPSCMALRKIADDERGWDWHVDF